MPDESRPAGSIGRDYYESSGYFRSGGAHLQDPESRFHRYRIRKVLELCGPIEGSRVVDLGSGWGTLSFALARSGAREVVGVDFAEAAVRIGEGRLETESVPGLRFLRAEAERTGLQGGAWDLVVAADLIEHLLPDQTRALYQEAHRLLRPGGRLVLWTPNPGHFLERFRRWGILRPDPSHVDYKTLARIVREVEEAGFAVVRSGYAESHLPALNLVERGFQRVIPFLRRRLVVAAERI